MPVYEFQCDSCGHIVKKLQKRTAPAPEVCPGCNAQEALRKIISRSSFHLKGGGWFDQGYGSSSGESKKSDKDNSNIAQTSDTASPASSTESTSESTTESTKTTTTESKGTTAKPSSTPSSTTSD